MLWGTLCSPTIFETRCCRWNFSMILGCIVWWKIFMGMCGRNIQRTKIETDARLTGWVSDFIDLRSLVTRINYILMTENIALAQMWSNCCSHSLWSRLLIVYLPPFPAFPPFTGSCPVVFKVICHSCKTNVLCPAFYSFRHCCPHMPQPLHIYFISFLKIHKQLSHSCKNGRLVEGQWKGSVGHSVTWKVTLWG